MRGSWCRRDTLPFPVAEAQGGECRGMGSEPNHKLFGSLLEDRKKPWDGFRRDGGFHGSGSRLRLSSGECVALGGAGRQLLGRPGRADAPRTRGVAVRTQR